MTDAKKLGIGLLIVVMACLVLIVLLGAGVFGAYKLKSITGSPCSSAPVMINGQQVASIDALQLASGHTFTAAEIANLGITTCSGGICSTSCPAVQP